MRASIRNITPAKKQDHAKTQSCFFIIIILYSPSKGNPPLPITYYLLPLTSYLLPITSYHIISNERADVIG